MSTTSPAPASTSTPDDLALPLLYELAQAVHQWSEDVCRRYDPLLKALRDAEARCAPGASGQEILAALEPPQVSALPSDDLR